MEAGGLLGAGGDGVTWLCGGKALRLGESKRLSVAAVLVSLSGKNSASGLWGDKLLGFDVVEGLRLKVEELSGFRADWVFGWEWDMGF